MTAPPDDILDLLTAYALDALEPDEIVQVSVLLEQQPELRQTLAELRATVQHLPLALPDATPAPELRQRTLDYALERRPRVVRSTSTDSTPFRRWLGALGGALATAMIVAGIGWAQLLGTQSELARTQRELAQAQQVLAALQTDQQRVAAVLGQANVSVNLTGTGGRGVVLRGPDGDAVVAANLPPLREGRVYELWLIQGQSAPVNGGTFTVNAQGNGLLTLAPDQQLAAADTFAVTEEPVGGSDTPTTPVLILGQLPAA